MVACPKCGYQPPTAEELSGAIEWLGRGVKRDGLRAMARDVQLDPTTLARALANPTGMSASTRTAIDVWVTGFGRLFDG